MSKENNIFLVGLMGAGKTTVGRHLAKNLRYRFIDSDEVIEQRNGVSISTIFDIEGEDGFRKREATIIDELTQQNKIVLATGGGAILNSKNREVLKERGTVVYLSATIDHLYKRVQYDRNRPLLQTENPKLKLKELLDFRDPLYREVADIIIKTNKSQSWNIAKEIMNHAKKTSG